MDKKRESVQRNQSGFRQVLKWSLIMLAFFTFLGIIQRFGSPIERHLQSNEFLEKGFVMNETHVWTSPDVGSQLLGIYEAGSILYVIKEDSSRVMVRPFVRSLPDSVWMDAYEIYIYTEETYRDWQRNEDQRKYREIDSE